MMMIVMMCKSVLCSASSLLGYQTGIMINGEASSISLNCILLHFPVFYDFRDSECRLV